MTNADEHQVIDPLAARLTDVPEEELVADTHEIRLDSPVPMLKTSVRLPVDLAEWAKAEAERRGLDSWSRLVRELLEQERDNLRDDVPVTVTMGELRRALHQAVHRTDAA